VSSLRELVEERAGLPPAAVDRLQAVVSDWQILADLSFSDLLLFCRDPVGGDLVVVAHMRPYTAQTVHQEDLVGSTLPATSRPEVVRAFDEALIVRDGEPDWSTGVPIRSEAIPVPVDGRVVAVITREANPSTVRTPSQLELTYLQAANELSQMIADGAFPFPGEDPEREVAPRVGDGLLRLDAKGVVVYASPNAISAFRRLGIIDNIVRRHLSDFDLDDVSVLEALAAGEPIESEVEARGAVVLRRVLPLMRDGRVLGALMLLREVTELRRHERLLLYKDATIREIHHRVKNNLQTVASLLRLQSRHLTTDEGREALAESVRRIGSIALVHETLSLEARQRVDFDTVAAQLVGMLTAGLADPGRPVRVDVDGVAGDIVPEVATPLALVLSELVQNALEHAFPVRGGTVAVRFDRGPAALTLEVVDDGVGVPDGFDPGTSGNLGLRIATALVGELGGTMTIAREGPDGGTRCVVSAPLPR
jgi:two-component system, sensor histidine kinase PdtaS